MRDQLDRFPMTLEAGHTALSIGLRNEVEQHLASDQTDDRDEQSSIHQFRFRLARMDGIRNPYRELIPSRHHGNVYGYIANAVENKTPLQVHLYGGLGDQLEMLSLVLPWGRRHGVPLRLMAEENNADCWHPCCLSTPALNRLIRRPAHPSPRSWPSGLDCLSMTPPSALQHGLRPRRSLAIRTGWCVAGERRDVEVYCQHTPFRALCTGAKLLPTAKGGRASNNHRRHHSMAAMGEERLQQMGVTIQNPVALGLKGLVNLCQGRRVLSIDTALVHLCAAMGQTADLLLPCFPDERWVELSNHQNNYGKNLSVHRSTQFGSWDSVIASLC